MYDKFHEEMRNLLAMALEEEKKKVICYACGGRGTLPVNIPFKHKYRMCDKCAGEGRIPPVVQPDEA